MRAFYKCVNLTVLELPDGIEEIGIDAFREIGIQSIVTPKSVRIIH